MKKRLLTILVCLTVLISACNSKQSPIDKLSVLAEELSENGNNYTDADWESAVDQFEGITEESEVAFILMKSREKSASSKFAYAICSIFYSAVIGMVIFNNLQLKDSHFSQPLRTYDNDKRKFLTILFLLSMLLYFSYDMKFVESVLLPIGI